MILGASCSSTNANVKEPELRSLPIEFEPAKDPEPVPATAPKAIPIEEGDPAPYTGILVPEQFITWTHELKLQRDELKAQVKTLGPLALELDRTCRNGIAKLAKAQKRSWFENPELNRWIGFIGGIAFTAILTAGAYHLLDSLP